jgi:DNA polymerase III sliding clamp (beta) subunit (PCNA family)
MNPLPPITLQIRDLRPALIGLGKVIGRKATLPVLACLHIRTGKPRAKSALTLTGTDLDTTLELTVPAAVHAPIAPFLIPLAVLQDFTKACGANDTLALQAESGNRVTLTRLYGNTRIPRTFTCPPVEEFPELPAFKGKAFPLEEGGKQSLLQALACASADSTRLILNGAYLEGGHTFVGTDGRHLYRANSMKLPVKTPVVLPDLKVLDWKWLRETPDWMLALDGERFCLSGEHWKITAKQIEGTYPNYQQILPRESDFHSSVTLREDSLEQVSSTLLSLPGGNPTTTSSPSTVTIIGSGRKRNCRRIRATRLSEVGADSVCRSEGLRLKMDMRGGENLGRWGGVHALDLGIYSVCRRGNNPFVPPNMKRSISLGLKSKRLAPGN